jgi:hypothetical protein
MPFLIGRETPVTVCSPVADKSKCENTATDAAVVYPKITEAFEVASDVRVISCSVKVAVHPEAAVVISACRPCIVISS